MVVFAVGLEPGVARGQGDIADLRARSERGDLEATNALANLYAYGQGVQLDYPEAIRLYQLAAERGLGVAHFNLGLLYETGRGVAPDAAIAFGYYRKAAERGVAAAQFNVGNMYANGIGINQDDFEALLWFRQAADQGLSEAQFNLASAYEHGRGVRKDEAAAQRWYRVAVAQGNVRAKYNLALMFEEGRGSPADPESAAALYRAAAVQNFAPAQNNLGVMLAAGRGTAQNNVEAYKWLALAVESGMSPNARDLVARQLTREELAEANLSLARAREILATNQSGIGSLAAEISDKVPAAAPARMVAAVPATAGSMSSRIETTTGTPPASVFAPTELPATSSGAEKSVDIAAPASHRESPLKVPEPVAPGIDSINRVPPLVVSPRALTTAEIPLQQLAVGDPRIARLLHDNARLNQEAIRANLRLVQVSSQLRTLEGRERIAVRSDPRPAESDKKESDAMKSRIEIMRRTIAKLAEENRWLYSAKTEVGRLRTENELLKSKPMGAEK